MEPVKKTRLGPVLSDEGEREIDRMSFLNRLPPDVVNVIFTHLDTSSRSCFSCLSREHSHLSLRIAQRECAQRVRDLVKGYIDVLSTPDMFTSPRANIQVAKLRLGDFLHPSFIECSRFSALEKSVLKIRQSVFKALTQLDAEDVSLMQGLILERFPLSVRERTSIENEFSVVFDLARIESVSTPDERRDEVRRIIDTVLDHDYPRALAFARALPGDDGREVLAVALGNRDKYDLAIKVIKEIKSEDIKDRESGCLISRMCYIFDADTTMAFIDKHFPVTKRNHYYQILVHVLARKDDFEKALSVANRISDTECRNQAYSFIEWCQKEQIERSIKHK